jgi:hypothetical protein
LIYLRSSYYNKYVLSYEGSAVVMKTEPNGTEDVYGLYSWYFLLWRKNETYPEDVTIAPPANFTDPI